MGQIKELTDVCAYFFEVLVKQFLDLERTIHRQSGLLSIFKKINYMDRANAFQGLLDRAIEAKNNLPESENIKDNYEMYSLAAKLAECLAIYINMVEVQIQINKDLNRKANAEKYNLNEYTKCLKHFDILRDGLESELPKLQSLYASIIKNQTDDESMSEKEVIKEKELADMVVAYYLSNIENGFASILSSLLDVGFNKSDFIDENWMKYDIFLCGLALDSMALFNLLDTDQANRIFEYISVDRFKGIESTEQKDYSINEVAEYKRIWDTAISKSEQPFDFVFSKLFNNLLSENIDKCNIDPLQMMQLITTVTPLFAGGWKLALEKYKPIN